MNAILRNYKVKLINIKNTTPSIINSFVSKIFVINLRQDHVKRNYIITLFRKFNIDFSLVIVDPLSSEEFDHIQKLCNISIAEAGCLCSHLWCLSQIIKNNYNNAIIFEDDIILHKDFESLLIGHVNRNPDFLLLGACDFNFKEINHKAVENFVYFPLKFEYLFGAHANYYSLNGAKRMFNIKYNFPSFFDNFYAETFCYFPNTSGICYPPLVLTDVSESHLDHTYDLLSEKEISYFDKCFLDLNFQNYHFMYIHKFKKFLTSSEIDKFTSLKELTIHTLRLFFKEDEKKVNQILCRLSFNFFSLRDIKSILLTE